MDAEAAGRSGVMALLDGQNDQMVTLRTLYDSGTASTALIPLATIEGDRRAISGQWLEHGGLAVGDAFRNYAARIVGELRYPVFPVRLASN